MKKEVEKKDVPDVSGGIVVPDDIVFPLPPIIEPFEIPGTTGPFIPGPDPQLINPVSRS
jgi:hypothetical protein